MFQSRFPSIAHAKSQERHNTRVMYCSPCKQSGRLDYAHFLNQCNHLPESDPKYMAKARKIANILETDGNDIISDDAEHDFPCEDHKRDDPRLDIAREQSQQTRLVQVRQSPYIDRRPRRNSLHDNQWYGSSAS